MIERYTIYSTTEEISERFGIIQDDNVEAEYNAAPTKKLPVIVNIAKEGLSHFYWGMNTKWSNKKSISAKLINASIADALKKSTLRNSLVSRRCIVPANGFYLWKTVGKKSKRPYYFSLKNSRLFGIPGIWEDYDDLEGKVLHTFRLIITENQLNIPEFGESMPAILEESNESKWLDDLTPIEELVEIIKPLVAIDNIDYHPVAPLITNIDYNIPEMIKIQPSIDQRGNYTLFE